MATKKVTIKSKDPNETPKAQIITGIIGGVLQFAAHENKNDRIKIPNGTELEVVVDPIHGGGVNNPDYYYITDNPSNNQYRRYFVKKDDVK